MTKQLFEEALADVKRVKQVAEDNAKRAVLEAVTPRIRDFIDQALMQEHGGEEDVPVAPGAPEELDGKLLTDEEECVVCPDAEGNVTVDINITASPEPVAQPEAVVPCDAAEGEEYEISLESIDAMQPIVNAAKRAPSMGQKLASIVKEVYAMRSAAPHNDQITKMISRIEDMYGYVQESVSDPVKKSKYEAVLEASFKELNKLQESMTMSQKTRNRQMNEADVTLKLTGLPDDIDLESIGVDLVTDEEGEEGAEMGGEEAPELDMGAEAPPEEGGEEEEQFDMGEGRRLSDDTIVEIDENMLRREIKRMRALREETKPAAWGDGVGAKEMDDFGGGKAEGEPLDEADEDLDEQEQAEAVTPSLEEQDQDLDEQDQDLDEQDQDLDEQDQDLDEQDLDQLGNRRKEDEFGPEVSGGHESETWEKRKTEATRRLSFERKLQERARVRVSALKKEHASAKAKKNMKRVAEIKKEYALIAKRFNESVERGKKMSKLVAEAARKIQESRENRGATRQAKDSAVVNNLRNKLAETNLFNAKLLYTNKLLQNERLSTKQKSQMIKQLDGAKSLREVKLVYNSLAETLAGDSKSMNESADRAVIGSASRVTKPASTQTLNEGYEAERWAKLAGIVK